MLSIFKYLSTFLLLTSLILSCSGKKIVSEVNKFDASKAAETTKLLEVAFISEPTSTGVLLKNVTNELNLKNIKAVRVYAEDLNFDSKLDLIILEEFPSKPKVLYFNKKLKKFDTPVELLESLDSASFLLFADFNNDKIVDLILTQFNTKTDLNWQPIKLFFGKKIKNKISFTQSPSSFKVSPMPTSTISVVDFDLDGQLDLFMGNWFDFQKNYAVSDRLFKNERGVFSDVSYLLTDEDAELNDLPINARPTLASSVCDVDQNGRPDILVANGNGYGNKLWLNLIDAKTKNFKFFDYGKVSKFAEDNEGFLDPHGGGNTFEAICNDYNNDLLMDIFLGEQTLSSDSEIKDRSSVLSGKNNQFPPQFIRTEYSNEEDNWNQGDHKASWVDLDMDGFLDLLIANSGFPPKSRLIWMKQLPDRSFEEASNRLGIDLVNPEGTSLYDFNSDGRPDIISGQSNVRNNKIVPHLFLFLNEHSTRDKYHVKMYLRGKKSNYLGIGSSVKIQGAKSKKMQFLSLSSGHLPTQNETVLYFTFNKDDRPLSAKVVWPMLDKNQIPLETKYNFNNIKLGTNIITLCETGAVKIKNTSCD